MKHQRPQYRYLLAFLGLLLSAAPVIQASHGNSQFDFTDFSIYWSQVNPLPGEITLYSLYIDNLTGDYYAAGALGSLLRSTDGGANWTALATNLAVDLTKLIKVGNDYTAVGWSGQILRSSDGLSWTSATTTYNAFDRRQRGIAANGATPTSTHIIIEDSAVIISTDGGTTWNDSAARLKGALRDIIWNSTTNTFVIVGGSGFYKQGLIHSSNDNGLTWTSAIVGTDILHSIYWDGSQYIAVGDNQTIYTSATASPGSWQQRHRNPANNIQLRSIVGIGAVYVAAGSAGTILYSTNLSNWNQVSVPGLAGKVIHSVNWDPLGMKFIAVGESLIMTSMDGINWSLQSSGNIDPIAAITWDDINTRYVAVTRSGSGSGTLLTSSDGYAWATAGSIPGNINALHWDGSRYLAIQDDGTVISSDGSFSWTTLSTIAAGINGITSHTNQYIAVGNSGAIYLSTDALTWSSVITPTGAHLQGVAWNGSYYLTVGANGTVLKSTDGMTWAPLYPLPSRQHTCDDDTRFTCSTFPMGDNLNALSWNGIQFMATGDNGAVLYSSDGRDWVLPPVIKNAGNLTAIAWNGQRYAVGSSSGQIYLNAGVDLGISGQVITDTSRNTATASYPQEYRYTIVNSGNFAASGVIFNVAYQSDMAFQYAISNNFPCNAASLIVTCTIDQLGASGTANDETDITLVFIPQPVSTPSVMTTSATLELAEFDAIPPDNVLTLSNPVQSITAKLDQEYADSANTGGGRIDLWLLTWLLGLVAARAGFHRLSCQRDLLPCQR